MPTASGAPRLDAHPAFDAALHRPHVSSISRTASRSAAVLDNPYTNFTVAHASAYWHQNARFSGFHLSGPLSPFARFAAADTASRCQR